MNLRSLPSPRARRAALAALAIAVAPLPTLAVTSTRFTVTGGVTTPQSYDAASLAALPATTQTVSFLSGTTPQTHTYTGASLWGVLNGAGIVVGSNNNDILNHYVLATATDGYKVVYSLGELNPNFGNRGDLIAYAETLGGATQPLGSDGFARTTAVGDVKGGRYLSNLTNLDVRTSAAVAGIASGGVSGSFSVGGGVLTATRFDLAALKALPSVTRTVNGVAYTGVSFWDLLNTTTGLSLDPAVKNDVLGKYVVATGSDGYQVVFSLGELSPDFGNAGDLIAYSADGGDLGTKGFARLVVPGDVRAGRWVSNLVSLEVFGTVPAVPEPSTAALLALGLGAMGWAVARRRARTTLAD